MKTLIYYVCFGELYNTPTAQSIWSLINVGKYTGDIVVIGDKEKFDDSFEINDKIKFINIHTMMTDAYKDKGMFGVSSFQNTKPFIHKLVNLEDYDFVLYLDSDVLVNTDKLQNIINEYAEKEKIAIQSDRSNIGGKRGINCGFNLFTEDEILKYGKIGLCSGIVGIPKKFFNLFGIWEAKLRKDFNITTDQGALHWVIAHNFSTDFEYFKDARVYRYDTLSTTTLLHFFRKRLSLMDSYFKKYLFKK